jgi:hypothetical protein
MKIPVTCPHCGKRYEVDEAHAGKRGKCANCSERMTIPGDAKAASPPTSETEAYELDQPLGSAHATSFTPARGTESLDEAQPPSATRKKKKAGSSGRKRVDAAGSRPAVSGKTALIGLACVLVVVAMIAVFAPGARMNVGRGIALAGLIVFLYGYGSGAYIAFTEDDLYGWLYLLFPPYAAYYFVSRWDEMRSRLVMLVVGLALLSGGGWLLEKDRPPGEPEKAAAV